MAFLSTRSRVVLLVTMVGGVFALLILIPSRESGAPVDLLVTGQARRNDGALVVSLLLSNKTGRTFDLMSGGAYPLFFIDTGPVKNRVFHPLTGDQTNLVLAARSTLAATITLTNPPARFFLRAQVRDGAAQARVYAMFRYMPDAIAVHVARWRQKEYYPRPSITGWIDAEAAPPQ